MATVSGNCFLQNQSDHSGTMVLFEALSPSAVTDSVFTSELGSYAIGLSEGIYAVHFSKDGFYPYTLPETPTYASSDYTIADVELIDGGSIQMVSGEVSGEWTSDVLYLVENNIHVNVGETLLIHAGTTVKFMGGYSFQVYGDLYVMGEAENMVTFTSGEPMANSGDWQGIYLYDNTYYEGSCDNFNEAVECVNAGCSWDSNMGGYCYGEGGMPVDGTIVVQYATIEYGQYGLYAQNTYDNNITILNSTIQHSSDHGIYAYYSDIVISGNSINDNNGYGIYVARCSPIISGNSINDNNSYGIYVNGIEYWMPGPVITTNSIENNSSGIEFNSVDNITITGNTIRGNNSHGIYGNGCYNCNEEGTQTITENLVENNQSYGMYFSSIYNADISNNVVRDNNGSYGFYVSYMQNSTVSHNTIDGNSGDVPWGENGLYIYSGENSKVMHNIITGNNSWGVRVRSSDGGVDFSYNNIWDNNNGNFYPSDDSPPELGNMITTNANGTDCDTYNNISENPLFVNPPINIDEYNLGWEVNMEDSTVHYELLVPSDNNWNEGIIYLSKYQGYYQDWNNYQDSGWENEALSFITDEIIESTYYFYLTVNFDDEDENPPEISIDANMEVPDVVLTAVEDFADSLLGYEFLLPNSSTITLNEMDSFEINVSAGIYFEGVESVECPDDATGAFDAFGGCAVILDMGISCDGQFVGVPVMDECPLLCNNCFDMDYYYNPGDTVSVYIGWDIYGEDSVCYEAWEDVNWDHFEEMEKTSPGYFEITVPLLQEQIHYHCDGDYTVYEVPTKVLFGECLGCWNFYTDLYLMDEPQNPLPENFTDPPDFNLLADSPCIDAGSSAEEYYDPDGTIADMGAYPFFQGTPSAPEIDFSASTTNGTAPLPVQFTHVNTGGPITTYSWDFGDGATSSTANPVHTYMSGESESFSVSLTVEGPGGVDVIEYTDLISVIPITFPPVSNFTASTQVSYGDVQFTAQANGQIDSYSWDFGDGNSSSEEDPLHSYSAVGTYSVSLTVSGPTGSDTETKIDYIQIIDPEMVIAEFEVAASSGIAPFTTMFTNTSMGSIESFEWDFGDGQTSQDANPSHTYTDPGSYIATLIVMGLINSDSTSQEITALSAAPIITSISDVPNDQGGRVYVNFSGSGYDTNTPNRNEQYAVEREDNDIWVNVGSGPAYGQSIYTFEVTTLSDSTSSNNSESSFRIIASMDEGIWISGVSSGYSIDNLAPSAPLEFSALYDGGSIFLSWSANTETDLDHYNIYRDGEILQTVNSNDYMDNSVTLGQNYEYSVAAVDIHGNESEPSEPVFVQLNVEMHTGLMHTAANLKSFYVQPEDASIATLFSSLNGQLDAIFGENTAAVYDDELGWLGSLQEIDVKKGYWLKMLEEVDFSFYGYAVDPEQEYSLHSGSNLISFPSQGSVGIPDAIPDDIENQFIAIIGEGACAMNQCTENEEGTWIGSLLTFEGTKGYWVQVQSDLTFSYDLTNLSEDVTSRLSTAKVPAGYEYNQSTEQAFYFIENIVGIKTGDWILIYNDDVVIGAKQWTGEMTDVPAMGDDGSDFTAGYIGSGSVPQFKLLSGDKLIDLSGEVPAWSQNQLFAVSRLLPLPESFSFSRAYPNPFNPITTLRFTLPFEAQVSLSVYNLQGRELEILANRHMEAGYHSVVWNADRYASGMYFVKMQSGDFLSIQKLMLVK